MKIIYKIFLGAAITSLVFTACDKVDKLPSHGLGTAPVLSSSSATVAPPVTDSNNVAVTFSWSFPKYATDSASTKYVIEVDSTGRNFAKAISRTVIGKLSYSFIAKDLNAIWLAYGFAFNTPYDVDVRVTSSYGNNNESYKSNVLKIRVTPYKIPPKVALPASLRLFMVGDASTFGWSNDPAPPFPPAREFARLDETTWGGIMYMNGSGGYKILQTQGVWSTQFHMLSGGTALGGSFELGDLNPSFPSPTPAGWYKIILDFQKGTFVVTPFGNPLPQDLYITGDATAAGWVNNPPANQKFTRLNSAVYEITMAFVSGKQYKFLSSSGNWQPQFGGSSATGGVLGANYGSGSDPAAISTPAIAGNYKITVDFLNNQYTVVKL